MGDGGVMGGYTLLVVGWLLKAKQLEVGGQEEEEVPGQSPSLNSEIFQPKHCHFERVSFNGCRFYERFMFLLLRHFPKLFPEETCCRSFWS